MKGKTYIFEVIIGVLVLIIISLCLNIVSSEANLLPNWFFPSLFGGIFTLVGAFIGATIAGKHAVNVMTMQQTILKREKMKELNFEFRKYYANVQNGVNFSLLRMKYFLEGKLDPKKVEGIIEINKITRQQLTEIPTNIISEEKYDAFIECLEILKDFELALEWFKEGMPIADNEIQHYRDRLNKANMKLRQ
ncbi:hypothetical protein [Sporosarcina sp. NPDC096371]|uniref:hypothetical protein n=1 Tax=Sporosarcina sp. NPDC096371 TaxID=3364530 RepID=UPI0038198F7B